ncbi:hypothetical protein GCM10011297_23040 [Bacterioplanes sanyensis]|uniref:DUF3392 domain-containing protein n=1 Tax=Bacterioplanes sanyensis TaxID=1249553 RepID=UPI00167B0495|nr:DUF3392 domain-containing protein [Bacterioplanes sanyensis]GGY49503.1 hypothetical protein GCM10011297_23040 [Bacterioplanes sanyensis]
MLEWLNQLSSYLRPYLDDIALAIVATLLVIFGGTINDWVRYALRRQKVWLRVAVFIALCAFGYGALSVWLTPMLEGWLRQLPGWQMLLAVISSFVIVGVLAERYRKS